MRFALPCPFVGDAARSPARVMVEQHHKVLPWSVGQGHGQAQVEQHKTWRRIKRTHAAPTSFVPSRTHGFENLEAIRTSFRKRTPRRSPPSPGLSANRTCSSSSILHTVCFSRVAIIVHIDVEILLSTLRLKSST